MDKVIVFDIGNVICFTEWERAGKFLEERLGIPAVRTNELFWGRVWDGGRALEWFLNLNEGTDAEFHRIAEEELGKTIPEGIFWEMWNKEWVPNEPVFGLVERLAAMRTPPTLAVCSNINQPHWTHLCSTFPVFRHFSIAALSYRVGKMKPDHAILRSIASAHGDDVFPPALLVDDRADNVLSAREFGWEGYLYERGKDDALEHKLMRFLGTPF